MHWAHTLDVHLFRWVNPALSNSFLDAVMPFFSANRFFAPALILAIALLFWKGGLRGRICVCMLIFAIALGDGIICKTLKEVIHRPRPFLALPDVHMPDGIGRTDSGSMPSSHTANWFAALMVLFIYYRRSIRFMLPLALTVGFSRIYCGVHYPGDVLAGAVFGAGYAAAGIWGSDTLWQFAGRHWFPLWWERLPSLVNPVVRPASIGSDDRQRDAHWMRLACALIFLQMIASLVYLASGTVDLTGDEAYQWIWSKHLALSYYSKPPLIAVVQFLGTSIWGDTVFGVRFFSPIIAAAISICLLRFIARVVNVHAAFWLSLAVPVVPLFAVGSILMTIDPLSVLFWTLAMISGWRAVQENSTIADWFQVGLWMGLGFLSKYTALFQLLSLGVFFVLWPPARKQLRRPGPWLALLVNLLCTLPVIIWNSRHHWITLQHVSEGGRLDKPWTFNGTDIWYALVNYTGEFLGLQAVLQNPFFFLPTLWAVFAFWRKKCGYPLTLFFFSMGAPLFLSYLLLTIHARALPNWIAPSIIPLFCLATVYWEERWQSGFRTIKYFLYCGLVLGAVLVVFMHDTRLIAKATGWQLPAAWDDTRRARGWIETTRIVDEARHRLSLEGKPTFIIGSHYSITGEITFHLPAAREGLPDNPLVYFESARTPQNQFFFWPGYNDRKGQSAIYVRELDFSKPSPQQVGSPITEEFESIKDLGVYSILDNNQVVRYIQMFECRNLR